MTNDAKRYGLHPSNRKEKMKPKELMALLDGLNVPYPKDATKEVLLDILDGATPRHMLPYRPDPQPTK